MLALPRSPLAVYYRAMRRVSRRAHLPEAAIAGTRDRQLLAEACRLANRLLRADER